MGSLFNNSTNAPLTQNIANVVGSTNNGIGLGKGDTANDVCLDAVKNLAGKMGQNLSKLDDKKAAQIYANFVKAINEVFGVNLAGETLDQTRANIDKALKDLCVKLRQYEVNEVLGAYSGAAAAAKGSDEESKLNPMCAKLSNHFELPDNTGTHGEFLAKSIGGFAKMGAAVGGLWEQIENAQQKAEPAAKRLRELAANASMPTAMALNRAADTLEALRPFEKTGGADHDAMDQLETLWKAYKGKNKVDPIDPATARSKEIQKKRETQIELLRSLDQGLVGHYNKIVTGVKRITGALGTSVKRSEELNELIAHLTQIHDKKMISNPSNVLQLLGVKTEVGDQRSRDEYLALLNDTRSLAAQMGGTVNAALEQPFSSTISLIESASQQIMGVKPGASGADINKLQLAVARDKSKNPTAPRMGLRMLSLTDAIKALKIAMNNNRAFKAIKSSAKNLKNVEAINTVIRGKAVGHMRGVLNKQRKLQLDALKKSEYVKLTDYDRNHPDSIRAIEKVKLMKATTEFINNQFDVKDRFAVACEGVDELCKQFTNKATTNPEKYNNARKMLDDFANTTEWYEQTAGKDIANIIDSFPGYIEGIGSDQTNVNSARHAAAAEFAVQNDAHYYDAVKAVAEKFTNADAKARKDLMPGNPFIAVLADDDQIGYSGLRKAKDVTNTLSVLKNLFSIFAYLCEAKSGDKSYTNIVAIYDAFERYIYTSAFGMPDFTASCIELDVGVGVGKGLDPRSLTYKESDKNLERLVEIFVRNPKTMTEVQKKYSWLAPFTRGVGVGDVINQQFDLTVDPPEGQINSSYIVKPDSKDPAHLRSIAHHTFDKPAFADVYAALNEKYNHERIEKYDIFDAAAVAWAPMFASIGANYEKYIQHILNAPISQAEAEALLDGRHDTNKWRAMQGVSRGLILYIETRDDEVLQRIRELIVANNGRSDAYSEDVSKRAYDAIMKRPKHGGVVTSIAKADTYDIVDDHLSNHGNGIGENSPTVHVGVSGVSWDTWSKNVDGVTSSMVKSEIDFKKQFGIVMRGISNVVNVADSNDWSWQSPWMQQDLAFVDAIKCMSGKIMTILGLARMIQTTDAPTGFTPERMVLGGVDATTTIYNDAAELYIRLPLLAQWYRNIFDFHGDYDGTVRREKLTMFPNAADPFNKMIELMFHHERNYNLNEYTNEEYNKLAVAVNGVWSAFRGQEIENILDAFIDEINRRYKLVTETEYKEYRAHVAGKKSYMDLATSDMASRRSVRSDLYLPGEESFDPKKPLKGPSDEYIPTLKPDLFSIEDEDRARQQDLTKDHKTLVDKMRKNLNDQMEATNAKDSKSIKAAIANMRLQLQSMSDADERLRVVFGVLQNGSVLGRAEDARALFYKETIGVGLITLEKYHTILSNWYEMCMLMDPKTLAEAWRKSRVVGADSFDVFIATLNGPRTARGVEDVAINWFNRGALEGGEPSEENAHQLLDFGTIVQVFINALYLLSGTKAKISMSEKLVSVNFADVKTHVVNLLADMDMYRDALRPHVKNNVDTGNDNNKILDHHRYLHARLFKGEDDNGKEVPNLEKCNRYLSKFLEKAAKSNDIDVVMNNIYKEATMNSKVAGNQTNINYSNDYEKLFMRSDGKEFIVDPKYTSRYEGIYTFDDKMTSNSSIFLRFNELLAKYIMAIYDPIHKGVHTRLLEKLMARAPISVALGAEGTLTFNDFGSTDGYIEVPATKKPIGDPRMMNILIQMSASGVGVNDIAAYKNILATEALNAAGDVQNPPNPVLAAASNPNVQTGVKTFLSSNEATVTNLREYIEKYDYSSNSFALDQPAVAGRLAPTAHSLNRRVLAPTTNKDQILCRSLAVILNNFQHSRTPTDSVYMVSLLGNVDASHRDTLKNNLPRFKQLFQAVIDRCTFVRECIFKMKLSDGVADIGDYDIFLKNILDASLAVLSCIDEVLPELADRPVFGEVYTGSIDSYKQVYGHLPLLLLNNVTCAFDSSASLMPIHYAGSVDYKYQFSMRGILSGAPIDGQLANIRSVDRFNATVKYGQVKQDKFLAFSTRVVEVLRGVVDIEHHRSLFVRNRANVIPDRCKIVVDRIESSDIQFAISKFAGGVRVQNDTDFAKMAAQNVIDIGKLPINLNMLMTDIPFASTQNYATTFDTLIKGTTGRRGVRGGYEDGTPDMASLLINPYQPLTNAADINRFYTLIGDRSGVEGMGTVRFLSDQILGSVLFRNADSTSDNIDALRWNSADGVDNSLPLNGLFKEILDVNSKLRLNTVFVRNLIFTTNVWRALLTQFNNDTLRLSRPLATGMDLVNDDLTDFKRSQQRFFREQ